jgi:hypothetical protein
MREFTISRRHIRSINLTVSFVLLSAFLSLIVAYIVHTDVGLKNALKYVILATLISAIVLVTQLFFATKSFHQTRLSIVDDGIVMKKGRRQRYLYWKDIMNVTVVMIPTGQVDLIKLYGKDKSRFVIEGFNDMSEMLACMKDKTLPDVQFYIKNGRFKSVRPILCAIVCACAILVVFPFLARGFEYLLKLLSR